MPIQLTKINNKSLLHGYTWKVADEQRLAELIAHVALGQARHVEKILLSTGTLARPTDSARTAAIKMLTVTAGGDPWHRDGWMFQVMSWLSAHKAASNSLISTPQMILADKGFDGIQLDFNASGNVSAVVIFEDKATDNARKTIREDVWPEFEKFESGSDENVLVAEVTGLLEKRQGTIDVDDVIRRIVWGDARHYRVSITVGVTHSTSKGRDRLFKDYDTKVPGVVKRRRGETFYIDNLRVWMDGIANKALAYLSTLKVS